MLTLVGEGGWEEAVVVVCADVCSVDVSTVVVVGSVEVMTAVVMMLAVSMDCWKEG